MRRESEHAALLRVAETAAGAEPVAVLTAVVAATSTLLGGLTTSVLRLADDGPSVVRIGGQDDGAGARSRVEVVGRRLAAELERTDGAVYLAALPSDGLDGDATNAVGVPIRVQGRLWGALAAGPAGGPLPPDTERLLTTFAGVAAAAVAGAEARRDPHDLVDEQAALLRVADLVAQGAGQDELFDAVAWEASGLVGDEPATLARLDGPRTYTIVASNGGPAPIGARIDVPAADEGVVAEILRTRRPARLDDYRGLLGPAYARDDFAVRSSVGVPVLVDGRIWGILGATSSRRPFPTGAEQRLQRFAGLMAAALANVGAQADLQELADEQAALRRVAQLSAQGGATVSVFEAVAREASTLLGGGLTALTQIEDRAVGVVAASSDPVVPVGTRYPVERGTVMAQVLDTGGPARLDDYSTIAAGKPAAALGVRASVGVPVRVDGRLWGVLITGSASGPLPPDTERRLLQFGEVVSATVSAAQARSELRSKADEQAALRHVAELAARGASAEAVLQAVAVEGSRLAGVDFTTLLRYEPDGSTEIVALDGAPEGVVLGMRAPGTGDGAVQRVFRSGHAARIDDLAAVHGRWPTIASAAGFSASVATPIVIEGTVWGVLVVVGRRPLPRGTEDHLANFADLVGTAVAAAEARIRLRALADEQAALRRVAELVARGAAPDEVFVAVAAEASALLGGLPAALLRYEGDEAVAVATCNSPAPLGLRVPAGANTATGRVLRTGLPARVDTFEGTALADLARRLGVASGVAVPVIVEGRVRATLTTSSPGSPLPADTEARLLQFADLTAVAIANAETKAKLTASRARVVATADETRRRLQRDVHDGAQQRLVHTLIALRLARDALDSGSPAADLIDEAMTNAERANGELRDLVHGILPASLIRHGLRTGLESLVADLALPVDVQVSAPRLPTRTETTAYFVVAEALTNVVKHAHARGASVRVDLDGDTLAVEIRDDGVGGADPARGTGLTGLFDRVDAAEGTLTITSPPGRGTVLRATLPVDTPGPPPGSSGQPDRAAR